jgi:preprotein translocase subunit YajC
VQAALVVLAAASKAKTTSGSSGILLLYFVLIGGVVYFLFLRPRAKRQRQAREQVRTSEVGDKIVTIGGLVGTIVSEDGDQVTVSTGNGTEVTYLRQAISRKLETTPDSDVPAPSAEEHPEPEGHEAT